MVKNNFKLDIFKSEKLECSLMTEQYCIIFIHSTNRIFRGRNPAWIKLNCFFFISSDETIYSSYSSSVKKVDVTRLHIGCSYKIVDIVIPVLQYTNLLSIQDAMSACEEYSIQVVCP